MRNFLEIDASYHSLAATISLNGSPVAFFSRSLIPQNSSMQLLRKKPKLLCPSGNGVTFFTTVLLNSSLITDM